ncbi:hypothetical protein C1752_08271 [Acaryochloris thomasi RCC1774]|uniref:DUF3311 domain-containing protein n=1 Tax=Acaryochloris thomasi RCC1774 TaxID=1764569 RepID=A0A2W1JAP9_9CYAN|nr:hypothetical protein [Acaryochloris thomasi]PZD71068.1 hypothetical protein C1752_08271 [Acaryochloris thomasi RCC1774]
MSRNRVLEMPSVWFFGFTVLFLLSLDVWWWHQSGSFWVLHLPVWVFYFGGLQVLLSLMLLIFSRTFWKVPSPKGGAR